MRIVVSIRSGLAVLTLAVAPMAVALTLNDNIPTSATRVRIPLELTRQDSGQSSSDGEILPSSAPADVAAMAGAEYPLHWALGTHLGSAYVAIGQQLPEMKLLGSQNQSQPMYRIRVLRRGGDEFEEVTSGVVQINNGNNIDLPVDLPTQPMGTNGVQQLQGVVTLRTSNNNNQPTFYANSRIHAQLSGSALLPGAKLVATLQGLTTTTVNKSQGLTLRIEPFTSGAPPRSVNGKLGDVLDVSGARLVAEEVSENLDELVLAVVHGDLEKAAAHQTSVVTTLPPMAHIELFDRRLVTSADLLSTSADSPGTIMIFGEFKDSTPNPNMHYYSGPHGARQQGTLPLSESAILAILQGQNPASAPRIVFVVRQIALQKLYEDYLGTRPPYGVISDYPDVLRVSFRGAPQPPHFFQPPSDQASKASLRETMGLPDGRVSLLVLDRAGKVIYSKTDIGEDLTTPLTEARQKLEDAGK